LSLLHLDQEEIKSLLPHRSPFLLVDKVFDLVPGERAIGQLHVREDSFWVPGHFPDEPIMPGVLISEAMAQVAGVIFMAAHREKSGESLYLVGLDKMRFRSPVRPGDVLELEVEVTEQRRSIWRFKGTARVAGKRVADGQLMAASG
jgi:3-hydroxyacyl-[acyl-carrier-protein] dehydratase